MEWRVGIVLFEDVEILDFCGPFEVFSATREDEDRRREAPAPFEVLLVAVCTGSMLLGFVGLLDGLHATTHWRSLDWMRESFPKVAVEYGKHFVKDGRVFTSAGISAGIDMSLMVVAHHLGEEVARATARHMEYPYPQSDARRIKF
ncbi:MAG: DJ-1/PfpI family protein [Steroidobacteraceae bacterium]